MEEGLHAMHKALGSIPNSGTNKKPNHWNQMFSLDSVDFAQRVRDEKHLDEHLLHRMLRSGLLGHSPDYFFKYKEGQPERKIIKPCENCALPEIQDQEGLNHKIM